ncbi:CbtA family protein [Oceaniglobus indicus]|uniref:CbtA family protein n=1 Tax=Oceaniglobus indicus TaxID=2047749 RepID=UPI000C18E810|nr:CbtA family protein [Oceaniglobus indicus]
MFRNLLTSAVFAGLGAGLIAAALQFVFVIPLLLEGELYETGARIHFATDSSTQSISEAPGLGGEWARHGMTVAFNLVSYTGYGFVLVALMGLAALRGFALTARTGLLWGICGFIAVQLAPAMGLPPELPGTPAAELQPRQIWWVSTIIATAAGLGLIVFARGFLPLLGIVLIAAPQLIGAPHLDTYFGVAPPELSAQFVTQSLGCALVGWSVLGFLGAWFLTRTAEATRPAFA